VGTLRLAVLTDEFCYTYNQLMRLRSKRNFHVGRQPRRRPERSRAKWIVHWPLAKTAT